MATKDPTGTAFKPTTTADWTVESDPTYQAAMASGQSQFNFKRNQALADKQTQETQLAQQRKQVDTNATESRRRLAGNFAARGMAGGSAGALALSEARQNAEQIAARTSLTEQLSALNQSYLQNFGATGSDWRGTLVGSQYRTDAIQQALNSQLQQRGVQ